MAFVEVCTCKTASRSNQHYDKCHKISAVARFWTVRFSWCIGWGDTVTLEGLEVGIKYQLVGWQMLQEENAELIINGKRVENDYTFTA